MNKKHLTRVGLDYFPPTIKIEYTKGKRREQYHCNISMNKYFNRFTSGYPHMSPVEQSMEVKAIVNALVDKHEELQQVPSKTFERMVEKLYLRHTQNNAIADKSVGDGDRDEQTTVRCSGDATRDGTLDYTLDLDRTLDGTLDATMDGTSTGDLYDTQADESCTTMSQTQYSVLSVSSPIYIHDKDTRRSNIRLEEEANDLLEAIRLSKRKKQVGAEKNLGNKWSFLKKRVPTNSKLVIEYPTLSSSTSLLQPPTATAATKNISKQETKPLTYSAQGQERIPQDKRGDYIWLEGARAEKRLMDIANTKARQSELMKQAEQIKALIALEKAAEKKAKREALIFMKREKQERKREIKAAAKEKKLLLIQQRTEEKAARIAARIATAKAKKLAKSARNAKELGYNSTAYQKNRRRGYDLPAHQNKTQSDRFVKNEKNCSSKARDDLSDEMKSMKTELAQLKLGLFEHRNDTEEWEEDDDMNLLENLLSCAVSSCTLPVCANDRNYLSSASSELKKLPRRGWLSSQPSSALRPSKKSLNRYSKSQTPRNQIALNNTRLRHQSYKRQRPNKNNRKKSKSRLELDKPYFL
ncbi:hypothetical protein ACHAW5_007777 [Stephanodiscus triporus]|uniref:Uncharacterized protein n=1 Tax=Stephanodiscus triporus TaxID=2934178 RepID=A0ABD3NM55_9STRA